MSRTCLQVWISLPLALGLAGPLRASPAEESAGSVSLPALRRGEDGKPIVEPLQIDPARTAVVVVDMWDRHWCATFTSRVAGLIPRMNLTLDAARKLGIQVIFAPSDVADFYRDDPRRKTMQAVPVGPAPAEVPFDPPPPPSGDFCECGPDQPCLKDPGRTRVWTRQAAGLRIADGDLIGDANDARELFNLCGARGLRTILYVGVASNMCVLYRQFGLLNARRHGLRTVFVRDLVDAITANGFNPWEKKLDPDFTPARGSDAVRRHLERYWAPSIASRDLLASAGMDSRAGDPRPRIAFVVSEPEYRTERTLRTFAERHLAKDFRTDFIVGDPKDGNDLVGLEALREADLLFLSLRRRFLTVPQMDILERTIRSGIPIAAIRVSCVPFARGGGPPPGSGRVSWERFDLEVLGCNYAGYDPQSRETGCDVWKAPGASDHPVLRGVEPEKFHSPSWLYMLRPLSPEAIPLLLGRWSAEKPEEPVAWVRDFQGARVFYTSLGHPGDFDNPAYIRLLRNAVCWALNGTATPASTLRGTGTGTETGAGSDRKEMKP